MISAPLPNWTITDRSLIADRLINEFPELSIDALIAAVAECDSMVLKSKGREEMIRCVREHLKKSRGTGARAPA
jgi:hypothetical protein